MLGETIALSRQCALHHSGESFFKEPPGQAVWAHHTMSELLEVCGYCCASVLVVCWTLFVLVYEVLLIVAGARNLDVECEHDIQTLMITLGLTMIGAGCLVGCCCNNEDGETSILGHLVQLMATVVGIGMFVTQQVWVWGGVGLECDDAGFQDDAERLAIASLVLNGVAGVSIVIVVSALCISGQKISVRNAVALARPVSGGDTTLSGPVGVAEAC